jgi:hypothetical protein
MNDLFNALGLATALCGGWALIIMTIAALVAISNRLALHVLESYGGWKTFRKYQEWYANNQHKEVTK